MMLDEPSTTWFNDTKENLDESHTYYVTYYDEIIKQYVNTTLNVTEDFQTYILPWWRQLLWTMLFGCMVVVATVGNLVVIWIVLANKRMRSVTNYFLVNLSIADAMVSTLNVTFNYTYMLYSDWPFGHFYCKFCQFVAVLSISASVFTLMAISIDRYVAIMSPLRPRLGKRATLAVTALIWIGSSILSLPNFIYFTTDTINLGQGKVRRVCYPMWPDGLATGSKHEYASINAMMLDEPSTTWFNDTKENLDESHTYYVTYYDEIIKQYVNTTLNVTEDFQTYILPWWRQLLWTMLFGCMVVVATVGNLVVIWIVLANKRMRSVTNYFLVNLSIADAMVSTLNVTFNYTYMLYSDWPFGHFYCKFCQFVAVLSISASVFTLMAISIDRYVAIMSPLRPRLGKRATLAVTALIWIGSSILSLPNFIYFTTDTINLGQGKVRRVCYPMWPDGLATGSKHEYAYNVAMLLLTYFIPIASMTYTYARVGIELWGSQSIGECTQRQMDNIKSKRRVVKMMIVVVVIFAVCWLPFHIYFIVTSYNPDVTTYPHIQEIYLGIYWLAMSNSMYNPIIYCWMNSKFRRGFKQFLWCCGAFGGGGLRRHRAFGPERSGRSLSPSRKNGTMRMSMQSMYNNTVVTTA